MTIEEYEVRLQAEMTASYKAVEDIGKFDEGTAKYYKGQTDAFKIALDLLKKLDHEVTLREVKEMCQSYIGIGGCMKCPLNIQTYAYNCIAFGLPSRLEPDVIQKRMKEAKHETQKTQ